MSYNKSLNKNNNHNNISLNSVFMSQRNSRYMNEDSIDPLIAYHKKIRMERKQGYNSDINNNNIEQQNNKNNKNINSDNLMSFIYQQSQNQDDQSKYNLSQSSYNQIESTDKLIEKTNQKYSLLSKRDHLIVSPLNHIIPSHANSIQYKGKEFSINSNPLNLYHNNDQSISTQFQSKRNLTPSLNYNNNNNNNGSNNFNNNTFKILPTTIQPTPQDRSIIKDSRSLGKLQQSMNNETQQSSQQLLQLTTKRKHSQNILLTSGKSLNDLKTESQFGRVTERQNIFLKQQEDKYKLLHFDLKNSIDRLNDQQVVKDAANVNSQVDAFLAGGIASSKLLNKNINNNVSLNQKLMEEGIISNTTQVSFIKRRRNQNQDQKDDNKAEELQDDQIYKNFQKVQIKSKNDLDSILGTHTKKEREEILTRVNKILEDRKRNHHKSQDNYNKWYISPEHRNLKKIDRSEKLYPYIFDQNYLYNNIDNYEDLYKDNPFDTHLNTQRLHRKNEKLNQLEHLRSMLANSDVIRTYTKQLVQNGERIPLFMKEVFVQDNGKVKARATLLNRYYNKNTDQDLI